MKESTSDIKKQLERIADLILRDGNINSIVNAAAKFEAIRLSFRGAYKDLMEEQKSQVRGGQNLGYDQM